MQEWDVHIIELHKLMVIVEYHYLYSEYTPFRNSHIRIFFYYILTVLLSHKIKLSQYIYLSEYQPYSHTDITSHNNLNRSLLLFNSYVTGSRRIPESVNKILWSICGRFYFFMAVETQNPYNSGLRIILYVYRLLFNNIHFTNLWKWRNILGGMPRYWRHWRSEWLGKTSQGNRSSGAIRTH
jgi:hypothetical protein